MEISHISHSRESRLALVQAQPTRLAQAALGGLTDAQLFTAFCAWEQYSPDKYELGRVVIQSAVDGELQWERVFRVTDVLTSGLERAYRSVVPPEDGRQIIHLLQVESTSRLFLSHPRIGTRPSYMRLIRDGFRDRMRSEMRKYALLATGPEKAMYSIHAPPSTDPRLLFDLRVLIENIDNPVLSKAIRDVVVLRAQGASGREIARRLGIAESTVTYRTQRFLAMIEGR